MTPANHDSFSFWLFNVKYYILKGNNGWNFSQGILVGIITIVIHLFEASRIVSNSVYIYGKM